MVHSNKLLFSIMIFPNGPICNLDCDYCYYKKKTSLYPHTKNFQMTEELLEEFIRQYIKIQPGPVVTFGWQGGEPSLRGIHFFKKAVKLQNKYLPKNWKSQNAFQTNGTLLTDEWCKFFRENDFLVGISIDGPSVLHDVYRKDKQGRPTHINVLKGLHLLQKYHVEYNVLCTVNNINARYPLEVYHFFKSQQVKYIQFIPIVESLGEGKVSSRTVSGKDYGRFLITIFDEWVHYDFGDIFIQTFEECVAAWLGIRANLCVFSETCGRAPVMEHNGDLYACDHFVFPEYKLGNILETPLNKIIQSSKLKEFGRSKKDDLAEVCKVCDVRFICNGGCPKNRIINMGEGKKLNFLCEGYKQFFRYIDPYMNEIAKGIKQGKSPKMIKKDLYLLK